MLLRRRTHGSDRVPRVAVGARIAGTLGLVASLAAALPAGCSDDSSTACQVETDAQGCFDYACFEPGPTRSFRADVLPIFEQSCALSGSCHGDKSSPDPSTGYRPYLGEVDEQATPTDVDAVLALIVGQSSHAAPSMPIVDPGKPESSFLMHKMDGDLTCADLSCTTDCGTAMPQSSDVLPRGTRDIVRDWIQQGAKND